MKGGAETLVEERLFNPEGKPFTSMFPPSYAIFGLSLYTRLCAEFEGVVKHLQDRELAQMVATLRQKV